MKIRLLISLVAVTLLAACTPQPKPIRFGADACSFCKMNIVDRQHAAEIVTKKGKVYMYDAIECMLQDQQVGEADVALYLVMDYNRPGEFTDATTAAFLISKNIPSPMGANLSAFQTNEAAGKAKEGHEGEIFTWDGIRERFAKQK